MRLAESRCGNSQLGQNAWSIDCCSGKERYKFVVRVELRMFQHNPAHRNTCVHQTFQTDSAISPTYNTRALLLFPGVSKQLHLIEFSWKLKSGSARSSYSSWNRLVKPPITNPQSCILVLSACLAICPVRSCAKRSFPFSIIFGLQLEKAHGVLIQHIDRHQSQDRIISAKNKRQQTETAKARRSVGRSACDDQCSVPICGRSGCQHRAG